MRVANLEPISMAFAKPSCKTSAYLHTIRLTEKCSQWATVEAMCEVQNDCPIEDLQYWP